MAKKASSGVPGAGRGGVVPPEKYRFKPGNPGGPGRKTAGATLQEWANIFAEKNLTELQLRKIWKDKKAPWTKRAAALQILFALSLADLADFSDLLEGTVTVRQLRDAGVDTSMIKKAKSRTTTRPDGETTTEREVELHDRVSDAFDRVCDRTHGRPKQALDVTTTLPASVEIITPPLPHE
jgi:hypothetical protein